MTHWRQWLSAILPAFSLAFSLAACDRAPRDAAPANDNAAASQTAASQTAAAQATYREPYRPQLHFSPPTMWMNDPNGMVFYDGEYHLFYQYHPYSLIWGPMHWGHAVSRDLVHWQHLPIALYPDDVGFIFSGSAVVDWNNTTGFGAEGKPPLVAIFTSYDPEHRQKSQAESQSQSLAYSIDNGRTWTKYAGNPVLRAPRGQANFRDPKVIWHAPSRQWIMTLAVNDHVAFYASPDMKDWTYLSAFGRGIGAHTGVWECPDLFPIAVAETGAQKWVLIVSLNPGGPQEGSGTQYFVGDFDGTHFALDPGFAQRLTKQDVAWLDQGSDNYAGVTWSDIPPADGRRLFIGWMSNWAYAQAVPTTPWRSAMTLPRELTLHESTHGPSLRTRPVRELARLRTETHTIAARRVAGESPIAIPASAVSRADMQVSFTADGDATRFGLAFSNDAGDVYRIGFDAVWNEYFSDRRQAGDHDFSAAFAKAVHRAPRPARDGPIDTIAMRLILDVASVELFADDGETVMTEIFFPSQPFTRVSFFAEDGAVSAGDGTIHALQGIWPASR
ncbi:MAG: glycoside hydrolase family 32 protein [Alphaproteobacteria bacterium]|nr:MAG: glycoside hydrolase family 32 protein [Alphaproteobacteria bacterium]